jgi:hypothetical protein
MGRETFRVLKIVDCCSIGKYSRCGWRQHRLSSPRRSAYLKHQTLQPYTRYCTSYIRTCWRYGPFAELRQTAVTLQEESNQSTSCYFPLDLSARSFGTKLRSATRHSAAVKKKERRDAIDSTQAVVRIPAAEDEKAVHSAYERNLIFVLFVLRCTRPIGSCVDSTWETITLGLLKLGKTSYLFLVRAE